MRFLTNYLGEKRTGDGHVWTVIGQIFRADVQDGESPHYLRIRDGGATRVVSVDEWEGRE